MCVSPVFEHRRFYGQKYQQTNDRALDTDNLAHWRAKSVKIAPMGKKDEFLENWAGMVALEKFPNIFDFTPSHPTLKKVHQIPTKFPPISILRTSFTDDHVPPGLQNSWRSPCMGT